MGIVCYTFSVRQKIDFRYSIVDVTRSDCIRKIVASGNVTVQMIYCCLFFESEESLAHLARFCTSQV